MRSPFPRSTARTHSPASRSPLPAPRPPARPGPARRGRMRRTARRGQVSARRAGLRAMLLPWVRRAEARRLARVLLLPCSCSQRGPLPRGYSRGAGGKVRGEREPRCSGILAEVHVWGPKKKTLFVLVNYKSEVFPLVGTPNDRSFSYAASHLWRFIPLDRRGSVLRRERRSCRPPEISGQH